MAKKKKSYRKKKSIVGAARGVMYAGAKVAPMYRIYTVHGGGADGIENVVYNQAGFRPDGSWDSKILMEQWGPIGAWTLIDTAASKLGVYRRMSRFLRNIM